MRKQKETHEKKKGVWIWSSTPGVRYQPFQSRVCARLHHHVSLRKRSREEWDAAKSISSC
jgi:hypothetical protein